jgi:hypothetical protein
MSEYTKQANAFATKYGVKLATIGEPEYKYHFSGDNQKRYVFKMKLSRGRKSYTFSFGQSINAGAEEPTMYDVLTCLQKYEVGSFEDFCSEFGYDTDSRTAEKTYKAVCREYEAICRLFPEIERGNEAFINEFSEIQ